MGVNVKETYNAGVIELKGKLMGGPLSAEIEQLLHNLIGKGIKNVVVDMSGLSFVNSSGLGILISGVKYVRQNGGDMKLANLSSKIGGLLSITKLNQVFEQFETVEDAAQSYR